MTTDPDDGDDEWRFSLEDLEDREDSESEDAGSEATESSESADGSAANSDAAHFPDTAVDETASSADEDEGEEAKAGKTEGLDAGVAGRMDFSEELEPGEIDVENALFVVFGVLLAIAFFVGFLNLFP